MSMANATGLTDSKKAVWRAVMALANVDGEVEAQEKAVLIDYVRSNNFPKEFESQLIAEIDSPADFCACYEAVTNVQDRAHLINTALVIFHSDDDFEVAEKKLFEMLNDNQRQQVDYKAASSEAREYAKQYTSEQEKQRVAERKSSSRIVRMLDTIADPLLNKIS